MTLSVTGRKRASRRTFALDVAFDAAPGVTILFGASGSGKTTLLRAVAGLAPPDAGRIAIGDRVLFDAEAGVDVAPAAPASRLRVPAPRALSAPDRRREHRVRADASAADERRQRVDRASPTRFASPTCSTRKPGEISGGERQRVGARALARHRSRSSAARRAAVGARPRRRSRASSTTCGAGTRRAAFRSST